VQGLGLVGNLVEGGDREVTAARDQVEGMGDTGDEEVLHGLRGGSGVTTACGISVSIDGAPLAPGEDLSPFEVSSGILQIC